MKEQKRQTSSDTSIGDMLPAQTDIPNCFVCGLENPSGLKLRFMREGPDSVGTRFTPPGEWTGWKNVMHGGFQALLLDETMAWVPFGLWNERNFVTREMTIRYIRPAHVEKQLHIVATLVEDLGRKIIVRGEIRDETGNVLTEARCTIVRLSQEEMKNISGSRK